MINEIKYKVSYFSYFSDFSCCTLLKHSDPKTTRLFSSLAVQIRGKNLNSMEISYQVGAQSWKQA
jgi:hypothetical protein